ncbi:MAG: hypothetical protein Tsb008_06930 [Rhodothalassiaceae bacterium]
MSSLWQLIRKDLLVLLREPSSLGMILLIPLLIASIFGAVNSNSDKPARIRIYVVDKDGSELSQSFVARLKAAPDIDLVLSQEDEAFEGLRLGKRPAALVILPEFGARLGRFPLSPSPATVELHADPKRGQAAGMLIGSAMQTAIEIIEARMSEGMPGAIAPGAFRPLAVLSRPFEVRNALPVNAFDITIPQAALWSILSAVAIMSGGLAVERTQQTLMRLRVSPLPPSILLGAKVAACVLTILMSVTVVMIAGVLLFGVRVSSFPLLVTAIVLSGFCFAGIMLAIGSMGKSPGSVSGMAWGIMVVFAMLGGGMIPQFLMPDWLQMLGSISPGKWTVIAMEGAIWRDYSLGEALPSFVILAAIGAVGMAIGVQRLRRAEFG